MALTLEDAIDRAARQTRDFLLLELRRTSPVRTGRYQRGWSGVEQYGIRNDVPYAIFVAWSHRSRHFEIALDEAEDYFVERLDGILDNQTVPNIEVFLGRYY